jgi:DNA-binding XRE family transcriptional regulator
MDLNALHNQLSRDATYVRAYAEFGDSVELALHCRAVREERGITQAELAAEAGVNAFAISRFEQLDGAEDWVISAIVHRLEPWLRQRGVPVEQWMPAPPHLESQTTGLDPISAMCDGTFPGEIAPPGAKKAKN